jgi:hypothetical protein
MVIKRHRGPPRGASRALKEYEARADRHGRSPTADPVEGSAPPSVSAPIPLFRLTLQRAKGRRPLSGLRASEWWYLVDHRGSPNFIRLGKMGGRPPGWRFLAMSNGGIVNSVVAMAHEAHRRWGGRGSESLEPRLLDIPALAFKALWLRGAKHDHLFPLSEFHGLSGSASTDILKYIRRESARLLGTRKGRKAKGG